MMLSVPILATVFVLGYAVAWFAKTGKPKYSHLSARSWGLRWNGGRGGRS